MMAGRSGHQKGILSAMVCRVDDFGSMLLVFPKHFSEAKNIPWFDASWDGARYPTLASTKRHELG